MNILFPIVCLLIVYYVFKKISYIVLLIVFYLLMRNTSGFGKGMKQEESKLTEKEQDSEPKIKISEEDIKDDTVLIFHATWCGYCKDAMSKFKDAVTRAKGKVILVDADKNQDLVTKYGIKGFPTIIKGDKTEYKGTSRNADDIIAFLES
jgi:thiol-disulfide isomerase/thioredoxin